MKMEITAKDLENRIKTITIEDEFWDHTASDLASEFFKPVMYCLGFSEKAVDDLFGEGE